MLNYQASILSTALKSFSILLLLAFTSNNLVAQSCDCIDPPNCNPCEGGLSSITLKYIGTNVLVNSYEVEYADESTNSGFIINNQFTINNSPFNETFSGPFIEIRLGINGLFNTNSIFIVTSCNQIKIGRTYNSELEVTSGISPISGPICCAPEDTDQIPPSFENFPPDITLSLQSNCSIPYSWTDPTAVDDCDFAIITPPVPGNSGNFALGTETISYSAIDLSGNTFTQSFKVTVIDQIPPTITGTLNDIQLIANNDCQAQANWIEPTASDNCGEVNLESTHSAGDIFALGTTTVTYTATDNSGNNTERSFDVIVSDNIAPQFSSFPSNIEVSANNECQAVVNWELPQVTDNCSSNIQPAGTASPGDIFPLGTTVVSYTAEDASGNKTARNFNIIVKDTSAAVFTAFPSDMNVFADNSCTALVSWEAPEAEDNCSATVIPVLTEGSLAAGSNFPIGTSTVSYKIVDEEGNEVVKSFNVNVIDDSAPVFSACPEPIELSADNTCTAIARWQVPKVTDNCEIADITSDYDPGDSFPIGTTEIVYTATDINGNVSFCRFNVSVSNDFAAEIEQSCPPDVELELFDRAGISYEWDVPQASLECASIELQSNYEPGDLFPLGETEVRYFYVLDEEEVEICSFTINVKLADLAFNIPQIISPNGDQNNDKWIIGNMENFPQNSVTIVDRWGGEVYKVSGYNNEEIVWDGRNKNGDLVPTGTYFYVISVNFESELVKKSGFIELIR